MTWTQPFCAIRLSILLNVSYDTHITHITDEKQTDEVGLLDYTYKFHDWN